MLDSYARLVNRVTGALAEPLPGAEAQALLSPQPRHGWVPGMLPPGCRQAAALVMLYERYGRPSLLLTLRRADLEEHAGQVSLPGGMLEPGESYEDAALREASEEVGVECARVRVLGRLTPLHIPATGFHLHPIVGATESADGMHPAEAEVERLVHTPLAELVDPRRLRSEIWQIRGTRARVPFFEIDGLKVWGATAMILAELLALLGVPPQPGGAAAESDCGGDTLGAAPDASPVEIIR